MIGSLLFFFSFEYWLKGEQEKEKMCKILVLKTIVINVMAKD